MTSRAASHGYHTAQGSFASPAVEDAELDPTPYPGYEGKRRRRKKERHRRQRQRRRRREQPAFAREPDGRRCTVTGEEVFPPKARKTGPHDDRSSGAAENVGEIQEFRRKRCGEVFRGRVVAISR